MSDGQYVNRVLIGADSNIPAAAQDQNPENVASQITGDVTTLGVAGTLTSKGFHLAKGQTWSIQIVNNLLVSAGGGVLTAKVQRTNSPESVADANCDWEDMAAPAPFILPIGGGAKNIKSLDSAAPAPAASRIRLVITLTVAVYTAGIVYARAVLQPS